MTVPPPTFYDLADKAVDEELSLNPVTKRRIWEKMGNILEIEGYPKNQIGRKVRESIEERLQKKLGRTVSINTAHYYSVMKKNKWTDPVFDRITPETGAKNTSYIGENSRLIEYLKLVKESCNIAISKLKNTDDLETGKDFEEFMRQRHAILHTITECYDEKTKIVTNSEHVLLDLLVVEKSIADAAKKYMQHRVQKISDICKFLTRKQTTKFQRNTKMSRLWILQPHDFDSAIMLDCVGQQCPKCDSWKTRTSEQSMHMADCIDCGKQFRITTITKCLHCHKLLYRDVLQEVVRHGNRCTNVNCRHEIDLPKSLVKQAMA